MRSVQECWPPNAAHLALPDVLVTFLTWGIVLIGGSASPPG